MIKKLDCFPIVEALRLMAVVFCFIGIISVINQIVWPYLVNGKPWGNSEVLVSGLQLVLMNLNAVLYQPLILLALAEIIKLMREKNDQN